MPLYRPSHLRARLERLGTYAKKSLSQNFLVDGNILQKILTLGQVAPGDWVLEVGPGPGALTEQLLQRGASVIAVEKDPLFAQGLAELGHSQLHSFHADIRSFPLRETFQSLCPGRPVKLIANLPYHLTTPILALALKQRQLFSCFVVMVQKEVAERMIAPPRHADYSSLSVFLQFYGDVRWGSFVSRNSFYPAPKVDSALVQINLREEEAIGPKELAAEELFFTWVRSAFNQRRKMLKRSLASFFPSTKIESALLSIGHPATARPEELHWREFVTLFSLLSEV